MGMPSPLHLQSAMGHMYWKTSTFYLIRLLLAL